jgi:hypothetical protein
MINATDIVNITTFVTKDWTKQRKAEERGSRSRASRAYVYSDRVCFTDVVSRILPGAYQHASGNGRFTVAKRQLYYACRKDFEEMTGQKLDSQYFANTLLVQYMNRHPETASWKVTADPRGTLTIPNAGYEVRIPCGTIQIEQHLRQTASQTFELSGLDGKLPIEWPFLRAGQRYQAVLYIEKEGFEPLLREAKIAERFDLAILSCKGQSVVAARRFVDEICAVGNGVPLFVVHDFDKAGFEIAQRLTTVSDWAMLNDRVTYDFKNQIDVYDLGLRLADAEEYELEDEPCEFRGGFASDTICTEEEQEFLESGRRIELNAFTAPQFIEWLEAKLTERLNGKRLIPTDYIVEKAYRRALAVAEINQAIEKARKWAIEIAEAAPIPKGLRQELQQMMKDATDEPLSWDEALYALAERMLEEEKR